MIVKNYKADGYVAAPPGTLVAALAFGPDMVSKPSISIR